MVTAIARPAALEAAGRQPRFVFDPQVRQAETAPSRGQRTSGVIVSPSETIRSGIGVGEQLAIAPQAVPGGRRARLLGQRRGRPLSRS